MGLLLSWVKTLLQRRTQDSNLQYLSISPVFKTDSLPVRIMRLTQNKRFERLRPERRHWVSNPAHYHSVNSACRRYFLLATVQCKVVLVRGTLWIIYWWPINISHIFSTQSSSQDMLSTGINHISAISVINCLGVYWQQHQWALRIRTVTAMPGCFTVKLLAHVRLLCHHLHSHFHCSVRTPPLSHHPGMTRQLIRVEICTQQLGRACAVHHPNACNCLVFTFSTTE